MDTTRVNKFLSQSGFCSRREADSLIYEGRVTVNNKLKDYESRFKKTRKWCSNFKYNHKKVSNEIY